MRDEYLVFGKPDIRADEIAEVVDSLEKGWIGTGPKVRRFEQMLEAYVEAPHVRCISSCTAGLFLALRCLGVGPGDEVIVPSMTFVASANAVEHVGARPILVDSDPLTGLMDLEQTVAAIGKHTKAIMPVHLAGRPVDLTALNEIRDKYGIAILEDAAHAIGARWQGRPIGSFGNIAAYSFYATKNVTTGEGGALALQDEAMAARIEQLALHGLSLGAWKRFSDDGYKHYDASDAGYKFNLTDLAAAIGIHQLPRLDEGIEYRREIWELYDELLADLPIETPSPPTADMHHARHLYQVLVSEDAEVERDDVLTTMTRMNIGVGVHYRAVHLHPHYATKYGLAPESLPVARSISDRTISLPLGTNVTTDDVRDVADSLTAALTRAPVTSIGEGVR